MKRIRTILRHIGEHLKDLIVWLAQLIGIMFKIYGPVLITGVMPPFELARWLFGLGVSILLTYALQERQPNKDELAKIGKEKNFGRRIVVSFFFGVSVQDILATYAPLVVKLFPQQ